MEKIVFMSMFFVSLMADGLSSKPLHPTINGVKDLGIIEMAYTNKYKDKDALKKKIATYPSPLEISKIFVTAYLASDDVTMLKISPKEMVDKLKTVDSKVRAYFLNIEKYDSIRMMEFKGKMVRVKQSNKLHERTIYVHMKNEKEQMKFGFIWVADRWWWG